VHLPRNHQGHTTEMGKCAISHHHSTQNQMMHTKDCCPKRITSLAWMTGTTGQRYAEGMYQCRRSPSFQLLHEIKLKNRSTKNKRRINYEWEAIQLLSCSIFTTGANRSLHHRRRRDQVSPGNTSAPRSTSCHAVHIQNLWPDHGFATCAHIQSHLPSTAQEVPFSQYCQGERRISPLLRKPLLGAEYSIPQQGTLERCLCARIKVSLQNHTLRRNQTIESQLQ